MFRVIDFLTAAHNDWQYGRIMALDQLRSWTGAAALDPVDGRYFPVAGFPSAELEQELSKRLWSLANDRDPVIAERVIVVLGRVTATEDELARGAGRILDDAIPPALRLAWFKWPAEAECRTCGRNICQCAETGRTRSAACRSGVPSGSSKCRRFRSATT